LVAVHKVLRCDFYLSPALICVNKNKKGEIKKPSPQNFAFFILLFVLYWFYFLLLSTRYAIANLSLKKKALPTTFLPSVKTLTKKIFPDFFF